MGEEFDKMIPKLFQKFNTRDTTTEWIYAKCYITYTGILSSYRKKSEKAMATHSSTLAWKIPWVEEPGGLQSMRSLRVGHN